MKTQKLCLGRFSLSVLLASTLATLPLTNYADSSEGVHVQTKVIKVFVPAPLPGQPIQLPDTVPQEIRADVIKILENTPAGQRVVLAPPGAPADLVESVTKGVGPEGGTGGAGPEPLVWGCLGWVLAIIVIIVIVVIIYVVWKCCQLLNPPPQTNQPPVNPAVAVHPLDLQSGMPFATLEAPDTITSGCDIQVNTDLRTTNWWTLCTLSAGQAFDYTNGNTSINWAVVTAVDTNGNILASTTITGSTNVLTGTRPMNIPYPGPPPDKLFLRLRAH